MKRSISSTLLLLGLLGAMLLTSLGRSYAHAGAPDASVKATAGPYALTVSVHPPAVVPGAAEVDVRTDDPSIRSVSVTRPGGAPQTLQRFTVEQIFTGSMWVANGGSWRFVIHVSGTQGEAETTVPVTGLSDDSTGIRRFNRPQWWGLGLAIAICCLLALFRRSRIMVVAGFVVVAAIFVVGLVRALHPRFPKNFPMQVTVSPDGRLDLTLPGVTDDLVDDHSYRMHLFAIREPQMDVLLHLHPVETSPGHFAATLPSMAGGSFRLFADVVHRNGTLQTFTASAGLPVQTESVLRGDDSVGVVPGLSRAHAISGPGTATVHLPDGYSMTLDLASTLTARTGQLLRVALVDPAGLRPADMELYMGMQAHAAVLAIDGTVFAHIHPSGTVPTAADRANMAGMVMPAAPASVVSFPFGFPRASSYRMFVQMKHGGVVETGAFDLLVR